MGYYLRASIGLALALAGYALFAVALVELIRTGTCASGGPYEIARECPDDTGKWAAALPAGIMVGLIGIALFAVRGNPPSGKRKRTGLFGLGTATFGLFFFVTGLVALYAEYGPGHSEGSHLGGAIVAATFIPMGLIALGIAFWSWRSDRGEARDAAVSATATGPAPTGFTAEGLQKLAEMQGAQRGAAPAVATPAPAVPAQPEPVKLTRSGRATVRSFKYLGESDAGSTLVEFELEVSAGGRDPYDVVHRQMVPLDRTGRLADGAALRVRVERDNPAELQIEW